MCKIPKLTGYKIGKVCGVFLKPGKHVTEGEIWCSDTLKKQVEWKRTRDNKL